MKKYQATTQEEHVLEKVFELEKENQRLIGVIEGMEKVLSIYGINSCLTPKKTPVLEWDKLGHCSTRLYNILTDHWNYYDDKKPISYIEDVTYNTFKTIRDAGKKSWLEFVDLRGY